MNAVIFILDIVCLLVEFSFFLLIAIFTSDRHFCSCQKGVIPQLAQLQTNVGDENIFTNVFDTTEHEYSTGFK